MKHPEFRTAEFRKLMFSELRNSEFRHSEFRHSEFRGLIVYFMWLMVSKLLNHYFEFYLGCLRYPRTMSVPKQLKLHLKLANLTFFVDVFLGGVHQ